MVKRSIKCLHLKVKGLHFNEQSCSITGFTIRALFTFIATSGIILPSHHQKRKGMIADC